MLISMSADAIVSSRLVPLALVIAIICLVVKYSSVQGLTLTGPWAWLLFALAISLGAEWAITSADQAGDGFVTALRFAAGVALICPQVSVLGAKRPQHRAWHAIVLSLWIVLTLPAAEGYFVRRSAALEVHDARGWFLWVLILVGLTNYLFTRHWLAASSYGFGQIVLLGSHLPLLRHEPSSSLRAVAYLAISAAVIWISLRPARNDRLAHQQPLQRLWIDFRDSFGAVWSLRIMDRLNQTARLGKVPLRWTWAGIQLTSDRKLTEKEEAQTKRALRTVLRRFVSPQWISGRLQD